MIGDRGTRWSIGELARASGVTVRTLYHYDETGLLTAGERTASGHRRYTDDDLRRLYRIRALRSLGLSLPQIAEALDERQDEPQDEPQDDLLAMRELLTAQLRDLGEQSERIRRLMLQIEGLIGRLADSSMPDSQEFMTTLEMMTVFETYFTSEQREQLATRRAQLGPEVVEEARTRWAGLVEQLLGHVQERTPVEDPHVQDLLRDWDEVGEAFQADGAQTTAAARRMWQENSAELSERLPWSAGQLTSLVAYLDRARRAR
ncbi:MerR family transcriptional regulator [Actinopolymorpha rutila]|uniref:DNA-binding transcriptional MerR regulator n=1 Tax=Actinopolymorpha rutila TaxID=446787 RepID=A0A852ZF13_9ACTN|nr:DNA-binding transcriptional MerR regulator [Actinopolymorpha rutila]